MEGRGGYVQLRPSIAYVKEQLGHSSIQVTVDVYGHFIPGANRAAVDRLAKAVEEAKPRPSATQAQPERAAEKEVVAEVLDKSGAPGGVRAVLEVRGHRRPRI